MMTDTPYIDTAEVTGLPGRLATMWSLLSDVDTPRIRASARVDEITGQTLTDPSGVPEGRCGGLLRQSGKVATVLIDRATDRLFLPNKPIRAVSGITVKRRGVQPYTLDVGGAQVTLTGGQQIIYDPFNAGSAQLSTELLALDLGGAWPFMERDVVSVTYDCGFDADAIPESIKQATVLILGVQLAARSDSPTGALVAASGTQRYDYGGRLGYVNTAMQEARDLLEPFRLRV